MKSLCIVGSGTAGSMSALIYRAAFPNTPITVISSNDIGIVGVGEGSTEHWKAFMKACDLPTAEVLVETAGTHKMGIRFEGWSTHTPDYFHSISGAETLNAFGVFGSYCGVHASGKLLTNSLGNRGIISGKVPAQGTHDSVNQFHFDTFKLNEYLKKKCIQRNIKLVEGIVTKVNTSSENGFVTSVSVEDGTEYTADFFIDATGFRRVLMNSIGNTKWRSFSKYLPMDSAIAFPSELPENKVINTYTRAVAKSSGWMWEIPTQERRGNGYVYSSSFISDEEARREASRQVGFEVEPVRSFKFDSGCLETFWDKNVLAIGLASAFVEPLEATSIGSTILQIFGSVKYLASFNGDLRSAKDYNKRITNTMDNLCAMIALHYISDRTDTKFWKFAQTLEKPEYLQNLLDVWAVTTPSENDTFNAGLVLFHSPHFWHVAQGQGVLPQSVSQQTLETMGLVNNVTEFLWDKRKEQNSTYFVDHLESLVALKDTM